MFNYNFLKKAFADKNVPVLTQMVLEEGLQEN